MRIFGRKAAVGATRWLRSRLGPRAVILGYHRVARAGADPFDLAIEPERFRAHLELIRRRYRPLRLCELAAQLRAGSVPDGSVVVTLDDGYEDALDHAKPALEAFGIPATVFVIAGGLGREMWWDEIIRLVSTDSGGESLQAVHDRLHALSGDARERELESLRIRVRDRAGLAEPLKVLGAEGVARLADGGLVEIGAHGFTHRRLAELDPGEQRDEILRSRRTLEEVLGWTMETFSYPHGSNSAVSRNFVREAGFTCACASQRDVVRPGSDPFQLPRLWVSHLDEHQLERLLDRWLGAS